MDKVHAYKRIKVAKLSPAEHNPRTHTDAQIEQLRTSIREFGFTNPLLVDEHDVLIAGHGRLAAAKLEGFVDLPAIVVKGLSETQKRALVIADNQLALNAGWDSELLRLEIEALTDAEFNLDVLGFDDAQMSRIIADVAPINLTEEWQGMPEFEQEDKMAWRSLIVHFKDQESLDAFLKLIEQSVTEDTKYLWFPPEERMRVADLRYASES